MTAAKCAFHGVLNVGLHNSVPDVERCGAQDVIFAIACPSPRGMNRICIKKQGWSGFRAVAARAPANSGGEAAHGR